MRTPGGRDAEAGMAAGVRGVCRRWFQELRWVGWQSLWVGTGLWLEAAICMQEFVVDLAEALERRRPEPVRWDSRIVSGVWERLIRVVRGCEPKVSAWRRLATRIDTALPQ